MSTLIYAPDVQVWIHTAKNGTIDVSRDIISGNLQLRGDGVGLHRLGLRLANPRRRYDGVFMPNDSIVVKLKRFTWMQVFTGYLNTVPFFSIYPRAVNLGGSCTFKRLQFWRWDMGTSAVVKLLQLDDADLTTPGALQESVTERVRRILVDVTQWPSRAIHMAGVPPNWSEKLGELRTALGPKIDFEGRTFTALGGGPSTDAYGYEVQGATGYGGTPTTPPEGDGTGYLPWVRGQATYYGTSYDAGGSSAGKKSGLGVNVPGGKNPEDQTQIGFGNYAEGWWAAYRMTYVGAEKIAPRSDWHNSKYSWRVVPYLTAAQQKIAASWWAKQKIIAMNTKNGKAVCLRFTDWGPESGDGRILDTSHKVNQALTDGKGDNPEVVLWFAEAKTPLGPVTLTKTDIDSVTRTIPANQSGDAAKPDAQGALSGAPTSGAATSVPSNGIGQVSGDFFFPITGKSIADASSSFNSPRSGGRKHAGIDIFADKGTAVVAVRAGKYTSKDGGLGGVSVHVTEADGTWHYYAHLEVGSLPTGLQQGQQITAGTYIGKVDNTGNAATTASHLHYSINNPGRDTTGNYGGENPKMDPYEYLAGSASVSSAGPTGPQGANTGTSPAFGQPSASDSMHNIMSDAYGGLRALLNDTSVLPFIQQMLGATQRKCCAAPNGDFIGWFPDYFGMYGYSAKMHVKSIEVRDAGIDWNDETFITHQFTTSSHSGLDPSEIIPTGRGIDEAALPYTAGIASVEFPEIMQALFNVNAIPDDSVLAIFKDSDKYLKHFGARPDFDVLGSTSSNDNGRIVEFWYAIYLFAERWTNQFAVNIPVTWMPELFPGMHMVFDDIGVQLYVEGVNHSWDFENGNFTTDVQCKVPSKTDGSGFFLPSNALKAGV